MEEEGKRELQLLPFKNPTSSSTSALYPPDSFRPPSLDLRLSITIQGEQCEAQKEAQSIESLKWQAQEQIRLAAMEKAYAERVRELTRREMEMAQCEFARAKQLWERAREEVERAERLKERATKRVDSACIEITCQSCRQRFKP